jgi:predicted transcriptional regulator
MASSRKSRIFADDFNTFDARAEQGRAVAKAIDAETPIPHAVTIRLHKFGDFVEALTPKRFELLRLSKAGKRSIAELAVAAGRDPSAVSKDIAKLVDLGLVSVVVQPNAGHGLKKIVRPVAENIEIRAAVL